MADQPALAAEWTQELNIQSPLSGLRVVDFADLDPTVMGRNVHCAGLIGRMTIPWTSTASAMDDPLEGKLIPSLFDDVRFRVGNLDYLRGTMDGTDVLDCARQRLDRDITYPSDIPVADNTGTVDVFFYIPMSRPAAPGSYRYDYCIPVQALNRCNDSRLTFNVKTLARNVPGVVFGAPTAVSVSADLVSLDDMRESIWYWERFSSNNQYVKIPNNFNGGIEALMWRTAIIGVNGSIDRTLTDATNVLVRIDGTPIGRAEDALQLATDGDLVRIGLAPIDHVTGTDAVGLDLIAHPTRYSRTKLARGPVHVSWSVRSEDERFILMATGDRRDKGALAQFRSAIDAPTGANQVQVDGAFAGKPTPRDAVLDGKIFWKKMPGEIARSKAKRMPLQGS